MSRNTRAPRSPMTLSRIAEALGRRSVLSHTGNQSGTLRDIEESPSCTCVCKILSYVKAQLVCLCSSCSKLCIEFLASCNTHYRKSVYSIRCFAMSRDPSPSTASNFVRDIENQSDSAPKQLPNVSLTLCPFNVTSSAASTPAGIIMPRASGIRAWRGSIARDLSPRRTEQCPATLRASLPSVRFIPAA